MAPEQSEAFKQRHSRIAALKAELLQKLEEQAEQGLGAPGEPYVFDEGKKVPRDVFYQRMAEDQKPPGADTEQPKNEIETELRELQNALFIHQRTLGFLFKHLSMVLSDEEPMEQGPLKAKIQTRKDPCSPAGRTIRGVTDALGTATGDIYAIIGRLGV